MSDDEKKDAGGAMSTKDDPPPLSPAVMDLLGRFTDEMFIVAYESGRKGYAGALVKAFGKVQDEAEVASRLDPCPLPLEP